VLVLSEFTGASDELKQALLVNPHDIEGLKDAMIRAIEMPKRERARRMRALRKRVLTYDVQRWSATFFDALTHVTGEDDYGAYEIAQLPQMATDTHGQAQERGDR
jgi:trehalose-6-phosphate synthase